MKLKKLLALLLAVLMVFPLLTACTTEPEDEAPPTEEQPPVTKYDAEDILSLMEPASTFTSSFGSTEYIFTNLTSKTNTVSKFTDHGFTRLNTTMVGNAKFETIMLHKGKELVTIYWSRNEIRILLDVFKEDWLPILSPNSATGTGTITLAQVGTERVTEDDNPLIGMCYIAKLSSGKAILIDGGLANQVCADNIYNTLGKLGIAKNAKGKYMIEAWIFTHGHSDHYGTMKRFAPKYGENVEIEYILQNMPTDKNVAPCNGGESTLRSLCMNTFPDAKQIVPHAGVKYYVGNATLDMLYTPDLVWSPDSRIDNYNDTSLVFKLQGGGASFFCYGDAGEAASEKMWSLYNSSAFKSNILQITHHALTTGGENAQHDWEYLKKVYEATEARYAFLPMHSFDPYGINGRNGRFTVMIQWCDEGRQVSFVMNESDKHGQSSITQSYYNSFCNSVKAGTNTKPTLYGYNGINKVVSESGLVTYLGANESTPMVTIFEFANNAATLTVNEVLYTWLAS